MGERVAGPQVSVEQPSGDAGHRLHQWLGFEGAAPTPTDQAAAGRMFATAGVVLLGRACSTSASGTRDADGAFGRPCFVTTHRTALFGPSPRYELEPTGAGSTPRAVHLTYAVRSMVTGGQR